MVVNMAVELLVTDAWVIESFSDVVNGVAVVLELVVPVSYFVEVLQGVAVEALPVGIGGEVLASVKLNVSAAVITIMEFPMSIP